MHIYIFTYACMCMQVGRYVKCANNKTMSGFIQSFNKCEKLLQWLAYTNTYACSRYVDMCSVSVYTYICTYLCSCVVLLCTSNQGDSVFQVFHVLTCRPTYIHTRYDLQIQKKKKKKHIKFASTEAIIPFLGAFSL